MHKVLLALLAVGLMSSICVTALAGDAERPFIWAKTSDRTDILEKIENEPWANALFKTLKTRADGATSETIAERRERLLALPLVWPQGKDATPTLVTFNRSSGSGGSKADQKALSTGLYDGIDCGVLYYLTQIDKYGQCAADILSALVNALAKMEVPETGDPAQDWKSGWVWDGHLYEARVLGAQIPIMYDFAQPYLKKGGKVVDVVSGELVDFDFEAAQKVFRTYIWLALNRGLYDSNWPVLEASSLVHNILALDDADERAEMLPYYLNTDTEHQASLKTVAKMYQNPGDVWPESLGYSRHVGSFVIYLMTTLDRIYPELQLGKRYRNIPDALTAYYNLQFPNDDYPFFGDGHRHYEVEYKYYEMALQLATINGVEDQVRTFSDFLSSSIARGKYDRGDLAERSFGVSPYYTPVHLLWSQAELSGNKDTDVEPARPRTNHLPFAGMTIQRIISDKEPVKDSLMAFTAGGSYIHGHASGMDMELYGQGFVLGIDGGKGKYGSDMHENYYRLFAAHNTVISNGASGSRGGWINMGINQVEPVVLEPVAGSTGVSPRHSFATSRFNDEYNLVVSADHQRTIALIKLSDSRGYYLDIFRARSDTPGQFHDYVYHNIGDRLELSRGGEALAMKADEDRYQASDLIPWVFHDVYQHPGWHFFSDVKSSGVSDGAYEATFTAGKLGDKPIKMRAYVPAGLDTEITQMKAPKAYGAAKPYNDMLLPAFALRHKGEAWENPFVVVYESYTDQPVIQSVERLMDNGEFKGVKVTGSVEGDSFVQYVIMQESIDADYVNKASGIAFKGRFAVVTLDEDGNWTEAYIGNGHHLNYRDLTLNADEHSHAAYLEK